MSHRGRETPMERENKTVGKNGSSLAQEKSMIAKQMLKARPLTP